MDLYSNLSERRSASKGLHLPNSKGSFNGPNFFKLGKLTGGLIEGIIWQTALEAETEKRNHVIIFICTSYLNIKSYDTDLSYMRKCIQTMYSN